jgi:hypothetical protein
MIGARHGCPDLERSRWPVQHLSSLQRGEGGAPQADKPEPFQPPAGFHCKGPLAKLRTMTSIAAPQDDDTLFVQSARGGVARCSRVSDTLEIPIKRSGPRPSFFPRSPPRPGKLALASKLLRASHRSSKSGLVSIALCLGRQHQLRPLRRYPFNPRASLFAISNSASSRSFRMEKRRPSCATDLVARLCHPDPSLTNSLVPPTTPRLSTIECYKTARYFPPAEYCCIRLRT